jgi:hypothetical protein
VKKLGEIMAKGDEKEDSKFGFKDAAKANETLELLQSHEKQYQLLTVRGLLGRAKRVLTRKYLLQANVLVTHS